MRISLSSPAATRYDFTALAALASACEVDSVQLSAERRFAGSATDALTTAPQKIKKIFDDANIRIAAIRIGADLQELPGRIALCGALGAELLICQPDQIFGRTDAPLPDFIDALKTAADLAASARLSILIENQPTAGSALRLWHLLDRLNHPSIGCCWDTLCAAQANDHPAIAIPLLNTRIMSLQLEDGVHQGKALSPVRLGTGELPLQQTIDRLRGIGFDGCTNLPVMPQTPPGQLPGAQPDTAALQLLLRESIALLKKWNRPRANSLKN
jgi:sugar phosphate isomerase/epimerase